MHYDRNVILMTFRALRQPLNPGKDRLEKLDEDLHKTLNGPVKTKADKEGIDTTSKFNMSMLIFFAAMSKSDDPATKAEAACKYFKNTTPVP